MSNAKLKQNRLSLEDKIKILKKLEEGVRGNRLAAEFGVTSSAISQIKKQKTEILAVSSNSFQELKKKTLHKAEYPAVESELYEWFLKQRDRNCPINGPILKAKAKIIFKKLYPEKEESAFNASDGWFEKFKHRHGIRYLKICGEILSSDTSNVTPFIHQFRNKKEELKLTDMQIYNADESGLHYRMLPDRTYVAAQEKSAPGRKLLKERITFLLCANADGSHKVTPLVIGKAKKPRCFKNFDNPLLYANSGTAWMTSKIFSEWFHGAFVKEVRCFSAENNLEPKAILLLDNCTSHMPMESLQSDDEKIIAMFLPPNVTALIQPMDQNPIKILKLQYRNELLSQIVANDEAIIIDVLKKHSIRDAICLLNVVWDNFPVIVLQKAWSKINNWDDNEYGDEDDLPLVSSLIASDDILAQTMERTHQLLLEIAPDCNLTMDEINEWNDLVIELDDSGEDDMTEDENDDALEPTVSINYNMAMDSVNKLIQWCETNQTAKHIPHLFELRTEIVDQFMSKKKVQRTVTDYFKATEAA